MHGCQKGSEKISSRGNQTFDAALLKPEWQPKGGLGGVMGSGPWHGGARRQTTSMNRNTNAADSDKVRRTDAVDPLGPNSEIGRKLKQYYDDLVSDDVPDRFASLLAQLEKADPVGSKD
jgi:hypothetical protein